MKSKKGKALAAKLINDLLGDDDDEVTMQSQESENSEVSQINDEDDSVDISQSIVADDSNPFGASDSLEGISNDLDENDPDVVMDSENDATVKINESKIFPVPVTKAHKVASSESTQIIGIKRKPDPPQESSYNPMTSSNIKASVGRYVGAGGVSSPAQTSLVQSENLRVAQQKVLELEEEISRLRTENEDLAAAGETLRRVADEAAAAQEQLERRLEGVKDLAQQEQQLMKESMETKDRRLIELQNKIEEMELRLSTNIQKIRVRERELENRLELVRMEGEALTRSKDEMVLDLKRQVDQLNIELENYRSKGIELNSQLKDKQELLRRTVKALRLALSMLEGDEEINFSLKKVK